MYILSGFIEGVDSGTSEIQSKDEVPLSRKAGK